MKKMTTLLCLLMVSTISYAGNAQSYATVQHAKGIVGQTVKVFGIFSFKIVNSEKTKQTYLGEEIIEVDGKQYKKEFKFTLEPGHTMEHGDQGTLNYVAYKTGVFESRASIKIVGVPSTSHSTTGKVEIIN